MHFKAGAYLLTFLASRPDLFANIGYLSYSEPNSGLLVGGVIYFESEQLGKGIIAEEFRLMSSATN